MNRIRPSAQMQRVRIAVAMLFGLNALLTTSVSALDETAHFEIVLEITWSRETTPFDHPDNPHLSPLVGATHNSRYVLFRDGHTASSGLELVAENGRPNTLRAEFDEAIRRNRVGTVVAGPSLAHAPGTITAEFQTTRDHPRLSFVTMLAPSPDWFTGAADVDLVADGKWIDRVSLPLWVWDAGTDSGATYTAPNADLQPRQSVRLLASPHFLTANGLIGVGMATIRRVTP